MKGNIFRLVLIPKCLIFMSNCVEIARFREKIRHTCLSSLMARRLIPYHGGLLWTHPQIGPIWLSGGWTPIQQVAIKESLDVQPPVQIQSVQHPASLDKIGRQRISAADGTYKAYLEGGHCPTIIVVHSQARQTCSLLCRALTCRDFHYKSVYTSQLTFYATLFGITPMHEYSELH